MLKISSKLTKLPRIHVSKLTEIQGNLKLLSAEDYDKLKSRLANVGFMYPIFIWKSDRTYIVDGHQRVKVIKKEYGDVELPYIEIVADSFRAAKMEVLAISSQYGKVTKEGFDEFTFDFASDDFEEIVMETSFDEWMDEEPEPGVADDRYEIPQDLQIDVKLGDVVEFRKGDRVHRLYIGDSGTAESWETLMQGEVADMVMTDPPYNVNYEGGTADKLKIEGDNMEDADFLVFLRNAFTIANQFVKKGGAWYVWHAPSEAKNFITALEDAGVLVKQTLIWVKSSFVLGRQDYHWMHEPCLYGWKSGAAHYFTDDRTKSTVAENPVDVTKMKKNELLAYVQEFLSSLKTTVAHVDKPNRNAEHPTMKPVELIASYIANSSRKGQLVIDGFIGGGSTMVACHQLGRNCYAMELDPQYGQVVVDRMAKLDSDIKITINGEHYESLF